MPGYTKGEDISSIISLIVFTKSFSFYQSTSGVKIINLRVNYA
jgi:hypothetical protein